MKTGGIVIMVDFNRLSYKTVNDEPINPLSIFERLVKPQGINDLYSSQREVLSNWYNNKRNSKDAVIKLHTGGGKTLVGLLVGLSSMRELHKPALYLTPTYQLAEQTLSQAEQIGIPAVLYPRRSAAPLDSEFLNSNAIMIGTYNSLFNAKSKFGVNESARFQELGAIILDDAHASFSIIRNCFTVEISSENNIDLYTALVEQFRYSFERIHRDGAYRDIVSGLDSGVLEVPYRAWHDKKSHIADIISSNSKLVDKQYSFSWPLLRDNLNICHALISSKSFTITPILPLVKLFPSFTAANRRIYMSANISDTNEIIRTFGSTPVLVEYPSTSKTLAGVSEKMILTPEKMRLGVSIQNVINPILEDIKNKKLGSIILVPSNAAAREWVGHATIATGPEEVEQYVKLLQKEADPGPFVFANRYDGVDLPGNACRLLIMSGLPEGTSNFDRFLATALGGSDYIARGIAQKIEQGIGRGARGTSDYCVVFLIGHDLVNWVSIKKNDLYLTNITRAQLKIGNKVSAAISDQNDLVSTVNQCFNRDESWTRFYRKELSDNLSDDTGTTDETVAKVERKVIDLWQEGNTNAAIDRLTCFLQSSKTKLDLPMRGWLEQLCGKIYYDNNNTESAEKLEKCAYRHNRNLTPFQNEPIYPALCKPDDQAKAIVDKLSKYVSINDAIRDFEDISTHLVQFEPHKLFEQSLCDIGYFLGFEPERYDHNGEGSDVIWLTHSGIGFILEAKNEKKSDAPLHKKEAGQLDVAKHWFERVYPNYKGVPVSVHPSIYADKNAEAQAFKLLSLKELQSLVEEIHKFLLNFTSSKGNDLNADCALWLDRSTLKPEDIQNQYLTDFTVLKC